MTAEDDAQAAEKRSDFWLKVAGISFGLWSIAIGYAVSSIAGFEKEFSNYVLVMERRVTLLEERQQIVLRRMERIDMQHENGVK
jgi:ABC-type lipoprotein release transport system permease subunit